MKNRVYLITGMAGISGRQICEELLERGERVRAMVLPGDRSVNDMPENVEIVAGDPCDAEALENLFAVEAYTETIVIHCAGMPGVKPARSKTVTGANAEGMKNIVDKCMKHIECKKLVYITGTGAVLFSRGAVHAAEQYCTSI